jgi:carbamoyl-phosphate synthase small subunit
MDLRAKTVEITSQNHNYMVDADSLDPAAAEITHVSLNDRTVEGLEGRSVSGVLAAISSRGRPGPA